MDIAKVTGMVDMVMAMEIKNMGMVTVVMDMERKI